MQPKSDKIMCPVCFQVLLSRKALASHGDKHRAFVAVALKKSLDFKRTVIIVVLEEDTHGNHD